MKSVASHYFRYRPFKYGVVARTYMRMHADWEDVQARLGGIVSLACALNVTTLLLMVINWYYFRQLVAGNSYYSAFTVTVDTLFAFFAAFPPFGLFMFSLIAANNRAAQLDDDCAGLLGPNDPNDLNDPNDPNDLGVVGSTGELGPIRATRSAGLHLGTPGMPRPSDIRDVEAGLAAKATEASEVEFGVGALRLAALMARSPCRLHVLGRKITITDLTSAFGLIALTEMINILGLGGSGL